MTVVTMSEEFAPVFGQIEKLDMWFAFESQFLCSCFSADKVSVIDVREEEHPSSGVLVILPVRVGANVAMLPGRTPHGLPRAMIRWKQHRSTG
ncbi:uncharacterized protein ARMOST_20435 [Armillaria ostoyae]|uniref:Uncharacterized protein n=1 Tax=Armillaria ostoyae TaxID=47428 RepID=A0A284S7C5_ARMOS|nr:uncharacterized protein ARMOST_20435 [Armillaria ostoyae]